MSIYIDARMLRCAGIGTYLKSILPHLHDFPITLLLRKKDTKLFAWLDLFKIQLFDDPIYSVREQIYYRRALKACNLFWSPHINVPYFSIPSKKRLVTIHDVYHLAFYTTLSWKERLYANRMYQKAVNVSDVIITDSKFSKQELIQHTKVKEEKIQTIHCGVDSSFFSQKKKESIEKIRQKYHLNFPYFLFVGNLKPHKNLQRTVQALEKTIKKYHLVIIGKAQDLLNKVDMASLIKEKELSQRVHVFSNVQDEELPVFYQKAVATVFPSLYEGFGLPVLEAMSCGCPVLGSNAASIPEVGGDALCYFNPLKVDEITQGMNKVATDCVYRESLIQKGYKRIKQFDWENSIDAHRAIIQRLLG